MPSISTVKFEEEEIMFSNEDFTLLSKCSMKGLIEIAKKMNVENTGDKQMIVSAITKLTSEKRIILEKGLDCNAKRAVKCSQYTTTQMYIACINLKQ